MKTFGKTAHAYQWIYYLWCSQFSSLTQHSVLSQQTKKKHCYLFNERKWAVEIIFHFIYFFIHWSIHLCNVKYCKGPMGWKIRLGFFFFFFLSLFCVVKLNTNSKSVFFFSLDFYKFEYMFYNNILKMNLCRIFLKNTWKKMNVA